MSRNAGGVMGDFTPYLDFYTIKLQKYISKLTEEAPRTFRSFSVCAWCFFCRLTRKRGIMNTIDTIIDHLSTAKSLYLNSIELSDHIAQLVGTSNELICSLIKGLDSVVKSQTQEHVMNFLYGKASLNTTVLRILASTPKDVMNEKKLRTRQVNMQRIAIHENNKMNNRLYSAMNCVEALAAAADHYGSRFTMIQYENYREGRLREKKDDRFPSSRTIRKNFGYWKAALSVIHTNPFRERGYYD